MQTIFSTVEQRCQQLVDFVKQAEGGLSPQDSCALHLGVPLDPPSTQPRAPLTSYELTGPGGDTVHYSQTAPPAKFGATAFSGMDIETLHQGYRRRTFSVTEVVTELLTTIHTLNP